MEIINKIKSSKTSNFLNRSSDKIKNEIFEITFYLPKEFNLLKRYWYIKNDIKNVVKCAECFKKEPNFLGGTKGYNKFCSKDCQIKNLKKRKKEKKKIELDSKIKDKENYIVCKLCNKPIKLLKNHLLYSHNKYSIDDYLKLFPNSEIISKSTKIKLSKNSKGEKNIFHKKNSNLLQRKQRSIFSIEYWKKKYPHLNENELNKKRNIYLKDKLKNRLLPLHEEYWINLGYDNKEAKNKVTERQQTFTLTKCINKYGKTLGKQKWTNRQERWIKSLMKNFEDYGDGRSRQSKWAVDCIKNLCETLNTDIPKKEKWISDGQNNFSYDFSYDFTYDKKIIEFNGDFWHANPNIYEADYILPVSNISAKEKWEYDNEKIKMAEKYGYKILVVWEQDYHKNKKKLIKKCLNFLRN